ncbi:MAG TPA: nuclear transport factor 2 family protein [Candidatus Limnocylindrales bacterium]|nr:nuclear transport factor 2 family protein [Candidatus Limnocylindrales bacterium]
MARAAGRLEAFTRWLTAFGDAWEAGDAAVLGGLFAVGATFQPTPFFALVRGRRAIAGYFAELLAQWPGASFAAQVLGAGDTYGVAHWRVTSGDHALDGVLVAALDARGRCTSLRQWWHVS